MDNPETVGILGGKFHVVSAEQYGFVLVVSQMDQELHQLATTGIVEESAGFVEQQIGSALCQGAGYENLLSLAIAQCVYVA